MVIISTIRYFISITGPYFAKDNDATIPNHIMKSKLEGIRSWIQDDIIFIVDRGFCDSITYQQNLGIRVDMPSFMEKGERYMSTEAANTSRLVTEVNKRII